MNYYRYLNQLQRIAFRLNLHSQFAQFVIKLSPNDAEVNCREIYAELRKMWMGHRTKPSLLSAEEIQQKLQVCLQTKLNAA